MLARRLVRRFRKFADQFLEHQPHVIIVDGFRGQIPGGEALDNQIEEVRVVEEVDEVEELEMLENLAGVLGKGLHVFFQVRRRITRPEGGEESVGTSTPESDSGGATSFWESQPRIDANRREFSEITLEF